MLCSRGCVHCCGLWPVLVVIGVLCLCATLTDSLPLNNSSSLPPTEPDHYECLSFDGTEPVATDQQRHQWLYNSKTPYLTARPVIRRTAESNASWPFDPNQCEPVYLYFLGRHSIRYASDHEAQKWAQLMPAIVQRMLSNNSNTDPKLREELSRWRLAFQVYQNQHSTESGVWQEAVIARYFHQYYPTLLDVHKQQFEVKVSLMPRTAETAIAFVRSLIEMQSNDTSDWTKQQAKIQSLFDRKFTPFNHTEMLQVHKRCNRPHANSPRWPPPEFLELVNRSVITRMVSHFAARNNLKVDDTRLETMEWLQKLCNYETAITGHSVWCGVFTESEWTTLNYLDDYKAYLESYGAQLYRQQSCVAIVDLEAKLRAIVTGGGGGKEAIRTSLYFSHDTFLRRLYAFLGLFNQEPLQYRIDALDRLCVPRKYRFRNALMVPFSGNMAVSLHRCSGQLMMFSTVNEVPTPIVPDCPRGFCSVHRFLDRFEHLSAQCDIDRLCPRK